MVRKVGKRGRIQRSLRSVKMRSHIAIVTPGSLVQSCEHQGEGVCVCVDNFVLGVVLRLQYIQDMHTDK